MYVCMSACMHACMSVCLYVCLYVCIYYIHIYANVILIMYKLYIYTVDLCVCAHVILFAYIWQSIYYLSRSFSFTNFHKSQGTTRSRSVALHRHSCKHGKIPQNLPKTSKKWGVGCCNFTCHSPWTTAVPANSCHLNFAKKRCQCLVNLSVACTSSKSCWNHCTGSGREPWPFTALLGIA